MSKSYDSVTPKRRPVIRLVLLATAICAIFTASVSAAQEGDRQSAVAAPATLPTPTSVAPAEPVMTTTAAPTPVQDDVSSVDVEQAVAEPVEQAVLDASLEQAPAELTISGRGSALVSLAELGLTEQAPSTTTTVPPVEVPPAPSDEVLALVADVEARDEQIEVLEGQLAQMRQEQLANLVSAEEAANGSSSFSRNDRLTPEENADAMEQWRAGYLLGGGQNLPAFENTILPCESGTQPNPDIAVGRTDDWGRSQINRPVWKERFESLTGADFETHIVNPVLNGYMAAHVELEQGLVAWTCWRKR